MPGGGSTYRRGGRKRGTPNKPKIDPNNPLVAQALALEAAASRADPKRKQSREVLTDGMNLMMGIAIRCQYAAGEKHPVRLLPTDPEMLKLFWAALDRAMSFAARLDEHPTFKAIMVAPATCC